MNLDGADMNKRTRTEAHASFTRGKLCGRAPGFVAVRAADSEKGG